MVGRPTGTARWETWSTYVALTVRQADRLSAARRLAEEILAEIDRTCSRFRPDSDLSQANHHAGSWVEVDPVLVLAVEAAVEAAETTGGLVHPLLGRPLVQLGYDRDLASLVEVEDSMPILAEPVPLDAWRSIECDRDGGLLVPAGMALDLGATAKAWASDVVGAAIVGELQTGVIVSVGGDVAIGADPREGALPWPIEITTLPGGPVDARLSIDEGGLATSSTVVRRWRRGGVERHHVLDPRTGLSAQTPWRAVTATGSTCLAANTASTAAVVLGADAVDWLIHRAVAARLVDDAGAVVTTPVWTAESSPG